MVAEIGEDLQQVNHYFLILTLLEDVYQEGKELPVFGQRLFVCLCEGKVADDLEDGSDLLKELDFPKVAVLLGDQHVVVLFEDLAGVVL